MELKSNSSSDVITAMKTCKTIRMHIGFRSVKMKFEIVQKGVKSLQKGLRKVQNGS